MKKWRRCPNSVDRGLGWTDVDYCELPDDGHKTHHTKGTTKDGKIWRLEWEDQE